MVGLAAGNAGGSGFGGSHGTGPVKAHYSQNKHHDGETRKQGREAARADYQERQGERHSHTQPLEQNFVLSGERGGEVQQLNASVKKNRNGLNHNGSVKKTRGDGHGYGTDRENNGRDSNKLPSLTGSGKMNRK